MPTSKSLLQFLKNKSSSPKLIYNQSSPINCLVTIDNWLIASADDDGAVKVILSNKKKTKIFLT